MGVDGSRRWAMEQQEVFWKADVWASIFGFDSVYSRPWSVHLDAARSAAKPATLDPIKLIKRHKKMRDNGAFDAFTPGYDRE